MDMEFQTKLLHGKSVDNYANGSTVPPISLANAFAYESSEQLEKVFQNRAPGLRIPELQILQWMPLNEE